MATAVPKARCRSAKGYATELATIRRNRIRRVTSKMGIIATDARCGRLCSDLC